MKTLKLRVLNPRMHNVIYMFDGKALKPKGDNMGHYVFNIETPADKVDILIIRRSPLRSRLWLVWQFLFFIVSLLGILDLQSKKLNKEAIYRATLYLSGEDEVDLKFDTDNSSNAFVELTTTLQVEERENKTLSYPLIVRRAKVLKILKIITYIVLLITLIIILILIKK